MSTSYIGIDPGRNGAVVALGAGDPAVFKLPYAGKDVDATALYRILLGCSVGCDELVVTIEEPFTLPSESRQSTATIARNYGAILATANITKAMLGDTCVRILRVKPNVWRRNVMKGCEKGKAAVIEFVRGLAPLDIWGSPAPDDAIADAYCIALFGKVAT